MKTTATIKQALLALTIALSIVSCKKDKTNPTPPPVEVKAISLADLKALSTTASVKVPDGRKITGIVISDAAGKNIDSKTVVLQDAASQTGIIITFDTAQAFAPGDQVEVTISNQTLAQVNGEIELTNVPAANAKKTGTGTITAKATTIADINTNKTAWDGTLVSIAATELSGGNGKFTGALTVKDVSGNISSLIRAGASFENTDYPLSLNGVTGIIRISGNNASLEIRKTSDVSSLATRFITKDFANYPSVFLPLPTDNFLQQDRNYYYLPTTDPTAASYFGFVDNFDFKGLKTVSVTFAGSNYSGSLRVLFPADGTIYPFTSNDKIGIMLELETSDGYIYPFAAATYNETGKFFTLNANVPTSVDELAAAFKNLADSGNSYWSRADFNDPAYMRRIATTVINDGTSTVVITNNSTKRVGEYPNAYAPVIIDKAIFGFDK